ncbi:MAG TPA: ABC transporter permease [Acidimicrobiia bacterium]|nr:ABC transporter permease [Acidimicrobiia bacterium]
MLAEDIGPKWLDWPWVTDHLDEIRSRLVEHVELTFYAVGIGLLIALPLAVLCIRHRRVYGPTIAITGVLYTIPALALFALLAPVFGLLSRWTAIVPLALYTLLILVRNTVTGFESVPPEVKEAAAGMGYSRSRQLWRVELPLALPTIVVGIRIAIVTTIGLVTVTALIGQGGLGSLILDGFNRDFRTPLTVGIVLSLALAVIVDVLLVVAVWLATPWRRANRGSRRRPAAPAEIDAPAPASDVIAEVG